MLEEFTPLQLADHTIDLKGRKVKLPEGEISYINSLYQVNVRVVKEENDVVFWHLSIKRRDKTPNLPWRHKQYIKNDLCGPETTAMEVFPPESKLVDTANQYHLWVFPNPDAFPFIWQTRFVAEQSFENTVQEPFQEDRRPPDLIPKDKLEEICNQARKELGYQIEE